MPKEYTRDQLWKLYEKLPREIKEAVFSEETADDIWNVCEKNGVEQVSDVAKYAGYVLMGVLPPDEFQTALEKEVELGKEMAQRVAREINRFIFYPLKPALEEIYKTEGIPPRSPITEPGTKPEGTEEAPPVEKPEAPSGEDAYRESIE